VTVPEKQLWSKRLPAGSLWVALLFLLLCVMIVGNFWILGWEPEIPERGPVRFEARPADGSEIPPSLVQRLGPEALAVLRDLSDQRALANTAASNPIAGGVPQPTALGSLETDEGPELPPELLSRLLRTAEVEDAVALGMRIAQRAEQSVRDPDGELDERPWLRGRLRDQALRGAAAELEHQAAALTAAPPLGRRRTLVIRGQARQVSTFVIGHEHASAREAATFDAWADLAQQALGAERFELELERGRSMAIDDPVGRSVGVHETWVEGWFDWPGWFEELESGEEPEARPFYELGRLMAVQLLNEAGLIELVFLGHGIEVDKKAHEEGGYQPFAMGPVGRGDEHQEVLILRKARSGFALRYGLTLDARAPFWAASCSNRHGGETRPDQSTTAVAFLLANGHYPDAASLDPFVFGAYRALQAALLEAEDPRQAGEAVRDAVRGQAERLGAPGELRAVLELSDELWLLRSGGSETPDLLLIGDPLWRPDLADALRITLATSSWITLEPLPGSGELTPGDPWHPCAEPADCPDAIDDLLPQAERFVTAGVPPGDAALRYRLRQLLVDRWVKPRPDATHRFLRLASLEPLELADRLRIEDELRAAFAEAGARRRLQGWVIPEP
jgi:hypothetical protein